MNWKRIFGLRKIKTAIAVALGAVIGYMFNIRYPFFICMTAIFSMDKTAITSFKMGRNRIVGTLIGATMGICFAYISRFNPILIGIGIFFLINILDYLKLPGAVGIAGIVFLACMIHIDESVVSPLQYGLSRTLDSLIGMAVSIFVNLIFMPNYNMDRVKDKLFNLLNELYDALDDSVYVEKDFILETDAFQKKFVSLENDIDLYKNEFLPHKKQETYKYCADKFKLMQQVIFEMRIMQRIDKDKNPEVYFYHYDEAFKYLNSINLN